MIIELGTSRWRRNVKRPLTRVQVLVGVEHFLEPLLSSEGSNRPQPLKRRRQVGEDGTASCNKGRGENILVIHSITQWLQ